jgi:hypothetical protein
MKDFFKIKKQNKNKNMQPLILGARAFVHAAKKNVAFTIYAIPMDTSRFLFNI